MTYTIDDLRSGDIPADGSFHVVEGISSPVRVIDDESFEVEVVIDLEQVLEYGIDLSAHLDLIHVKYVTSGHPDGAFFDYSTARLEGTTDYHILYVTNVAGLVD